MNTIQHYQFLSIGNYFDLTTHSRMFHLNKYWNGLYYLYPSLLKDKLKLQFQLLIEKDEIRSVLKVQNSSGYTFLQNRQCKGLLSFCFNIDIKVDCYGDGLNSDSFMIATSLLTFILNALQYIKNINLFFSDPLVQPTWGLYSNVVDVINQRVNDTIQTHVNCNPAPSTFHHITVTSMEIFYSHLLNLSSISIGYINNYFNIPVTFTHLTKITMYYNRYDASSLLSFTKTIQLLQNQLTDVTISLSVPRNVDKTYMLELAERKELKDLINSIEPMTNLVHFGFVALLASPCIFEYLFIHLPKTITSLTLGSNGSIIGSFDFKHCQSHINIKQLNLPMYGFKCFNTEYKLFQRLFPNIETLCCKNNTKSYLETPHAKQLFIDCKPNIQSIVDGFTHLQTIDYRILPTITQKLPVKEFLSIINGTLISTLLHNMEH